MEFLAEIVINCGTTSLPSRLSLGGEANDHSILVDRIEWTVGSASGGTLLAHATMPQPVAVPHDLLTVAGGGTKQFCSATVLQAKIDALYKQGQFKAAAQLDALREDVARRFRNVAVDWAESGTFLGSQVQGEVKGSISLALEQLLLSFTGDASINGSARALIELRAEASVAASGGPVGLQGAAAIAVRIRVDAAATIALDVDDLNLSLPEIELPDLDFSLGGLDLRFPDIPSLPALPSRFSGMFGQFARDVNVKVTTASGAAPRLLVAMGAKGVCAAVVTAAAPPSSLGGKADAALLEPLTLKVERGGTTFLTFDQLKVGIFAQGAILSFKSAVGGSTPLADGRSSFSPLELAWKGATVTPSVTQIASGGMKTPVAAALLRFDRLTLSLFEDPATSLSFKGAIELTPGGVRIVELSLVAPYPLTLVKAASGALLRGAHKLVDLMAEIEWKQGDLEAIKALLRILGKFASAVGRAAFSVTGQLQSVLATAAGALEATLVRAGELIAKLIEQLASLLPDSLPGTAPPPKLAIELRVATEPFALQQFLVSLRELPKEDRVLSTLGLNLSLSKGWHPAFLIDLTGTPSAYLLARRHDPSAKVASFSTDLWLKTDGSEGVAAVRDAEKETGDRAAKRLITIEVETKLETIMLVGLEGGETTILQRAVNVDGDPILTNPVRILPNGIRFEEFKGKGIEHLGDEEIDVKVDFDKERILPLLGMGEPGTEPAQTGSPTFLDRLKNSLSQVVTVKDSSAKLKKIDEELVSPPTVEITLDLDIRMAGLASQVALLIDLDLKTFDAKLNLGDENKIDIRGQRIDEQAMGLRWIVEPKPTQAQAKLLASSLTSTSTGSAATLPPNDDFPLFELQFANGEQRLSLHKEARMQIHLGGLSSDGGALIFEASRFSVGRGGVDLEARIGDDRQTVKLSGIDQNFKFTDGRIVISGSRLSQATIEGKGQLPEKLVGEADCKIILMLGQDKNGIFVQSGKVVMEKIGQPITCHATRFTLTLSEIGLDFVRENKRYHFYFLLTGSLRFEPKKGEFEDGLLKHLADVEMVLDKVPLTSDPKVLVRHISFQKAIKPPATFSLFNLFKMQIRGIGYHPAAAKFEGDPAICISGQIDFVELGDIMKPKIDFHGLWIAPPKKGESLPRIKAEGLGVDLQLSGAVKVRGAVLAVDPDTRTVEGKELAPPGYKAYGFLGQGELEIPGWGVMEASLGFLEVEKDGKRKLAFFFYLQKNKLAVEIPTPIWTFWLREAGFGFGYRYTLTAIKEAETATSVAQLVRVLDEVSKSQGDLARYSAWKPDVDKNHFTLALRGAFQPYPAQKVWNQAREEKATMPFFFDVIAALRSDMTLMMSARGWLGVNYNSFLLNKDDFRSRPGLRGYLYISPARRELLLRGIADSKGHIGEDWPELRGQSVLRKAVQSVDWSMLLYVRPGLFHYEMGWPDQLAVRLADSERMKVTVRGGMIFRAAEDGLLFGYNIEADAWVRFAGRAGGSVGAALEAELKANLIARVIAYLTPQFSGSLVYGLASLDARVKFAVSAWMEVDLGIKTFTIRIGFNFSVQFSAAVEFVLTDQTVGGRVAARVGVQAFGCTITVGVGFSFNDGALGSARSRVARFLAMSLTNEETATLPSAAAGRGDQIVDNIAATAPKNPALPPPSPPPSPTPSPTPTPAPAPAPTKPPIDRTAGAQPIKTTHFYLVLRNRKDMPGRAIALLIPRESPDLETAGSFYASPTPHQAPRLEADPRYQLNDIPPDLRDVNIWVPGATAAGAFNGKFAPLNVATGLSHVPVHCRWNATIPGAEGFTLGHFFDECFRTLTEWKNDERLTRVYCEAAKPRVHAVPERIDRDLSPREREIARDRVQRERAAEAAQDVDDERLYAARSTLMAMFLDQWATIDIPALEVRTDQSAHVADLGLLFEGPVEELEKLEKMTVRKLDTTDVEPGKIVVLNPRTSWFDEADPVLADVRSDIGVDGIKLDWALALAAGSDVVVEDEKLNPEHRLHTYRIERTIEGLGLDLDPILVKGAALMGARAKTDGESGTDEETPKIDPRIELKAPDWQLVDGLDEAGGVPAEIRAALLPGNGPEARLSAATAWARRFPERDSVTMTYTVVPVDIAGTEAKARSFVVAIPRPAMPVRAATGEIRIIQKMAKTAGGSDAAAFATIDKDYSLYLAMQDKAWDEADLAEGVVAERIYRLWVESDEVEPEGSYASDGATARLRSPALRGPTAGARYIDIARGHFSKGERKDDILAIENIEPDAEERGSFTHWARLSAAKFEEAKAAVFANQTAARDFAKQWFDPARSRRVAARFWLQTIIRVPAATRPIEHVSAFVELPIEHSLLQPGRLAGSTMRPEAFELAVPMAMRPLGPDQVEARSGLAQYFVPDAAGDIKQLLEGRVASISDPERKVATEVAFDAVPDWERDPAIGFHASAIAGFDVYELDLDELPPSDEERDLAVDAAPWAAARRIAHIVEVGDDTAALLPDGNRDWKAWRSHFPAATAEALKARGSHAEEESDTGTKRLADREPLAPAESDERLLSPPDRFPRVRLLPLAPEQTISELLEKGVPETIKAQFTLAPNSPVRDTLARRLGRAASDEEMLAVLPRIDILCELVVVEDGDQLSALPQFSCDYEGGPPRLGSGSQPVAVLSGPVHGFAASDIRDLLLKISSIAADWKKSVEDGPSLLGLWRSDPRALDGLGLRLSAFRGGVQTGASDIVLDLSSPIHPILEETLAELELQRQTSTYRGLTVMPQVPPPSSATEMLGLIASSPPETDPYGWGVLQMLGLARTVRIHDPSKDEFLCGPALVERVKLVFDTCQKRWLKHWHDGDETPLCLGQPFIDVCLKANRDTWLSGFDKPQRAEEVATGGRFSLEDDSLAFVQIALRPGEVEDANYWTCVVGVDGTVATSIATGSQIEIEIEIEIEIPAVWDIRRLSDSAKGELQPSALTCRFSFDGTPQTYLFRGPADAQQGGLPPTVRLVVDDKPSDKLPVDWVKVERPLEAKLDALFERVADRTPAQWRAAWTSFDGNTTAGRVLARWRATAEAAVPGIAWPADAALEPFAASFRPWIRRFRDHRGTKPTTNDLTYSLSALIDDKPLRLAAGTDGRLRFRIVRPDRWGSVRAYAVKPLGRYHVVLAGAGVEAETASTTLVRPHPAEGTKWSFTDASFITPHAPIGYGIAVSQRTEKVEKPTVIDMRMIGEAEAGEDSWAEIIVARHGEEALASSNRTVLARLGVPSSAASFARTYRHPEWPARLDAALPVKVYPDRVYERIVEGDAKPLRGADLYKIVARAPAVAFGADVWRVSPQPPHYRLVSTFFERAGGVVSDPVVTIHDDMPRRTLAGRSADVFDQHRAPTAELLRLEGRLILNLTHGLIAYHDVTPERSLNWVSGGATDIAHWPDPDMVYNLSRRRGSMGAVEETSEEAEIRLVPVLAKDANGSAPTPIVVRPRGTLLEKEVVTVLNHASVDKKTHFHLRSELILAAAASLAGRKARSEVMALSVAPADINKVMLFNSMAAPFGAVELIHEVVPDLGRKGTTTGAAYLALLEQRAKNGREVGVTLWTEKLERWLLTANRTLPVAKLESQAADAAGAPFDWPLAVGIQNVNGLAFKQRDGQAWFRGWDGMSDAEAAAPAWKDIFSPADHRRIREWLARRLVGSFDSLWLRAVDGRSKLPPDQLSAADCQVVLPKWVEEALS